MDIRELRIFVAVAEELHFGRAADRLHRSTSPVSRAIKNLERQLGGSLFVRKHHGVALTEMGEDLLERARNVLDAMEDLEQRASEWARGDTAVLRVASSLLAPPGVFDAVLAMVRKALPEGRIVTSAAAAPELCALLEQSEIDLAVVSLPVHSNDIDSFELVKYPLYVAMSISDPLAKLEAASLSALQGRAMIFPSAVLHTDVFQEFSQRLKAAGIQHSQQPETYDSIKVATLVRQGGVLTLSLDPSLGGAAKVYDDSAFALVPLLDFEYSLGLVWCRRFASDLAIARVLTAFQARWTPEF